MSSEYDIIFAGGGTTACVIAGRLLDADPSLRILIVESGQHSRELATHTQPCRFLHHLAPNSTTVSFHVSKSSVHLDGRSIGVQCGRAVGGGSTVNFMLYVRGAASDYDDWEAHGNKGWGFNQVLPLIRKFETFTPIPDKPTHGYSGPIQISAGGIDLGFGSQFLDVARAYDPSRPQIDDINDFQSANAYSRAYIYVDPTSGKRCDAASKYLYWHVENPNLTIVVGKPVKRVIIENARAVGIEYGSELVAVKATKLVVVSAGAFGSPPILERSGIGAPSILRKNGIPVLVDLPGVGENYQDHVGAFSAFYASDETETMDDVFTDPEAIPSQLQEWESKGTGKIAHTGMEAMAKVRPTTTQLTSMGPALQSRWESFFQHRPDKPMGIIVPFASSPPDLLSSQTGRKIVSSIHYLTYPESIGSVHITSGDADSPVDFDNQFCSTAADVAQFTLLYKMTRELFRRMPSYRGEVAIQHPQFPLGSSAACTETAVPVPIDAPDIVYSDADDEAIAKYHRDRIFTTWHALGTCAMKPRDQGGVVDDRLNVYGVKGLKVADMSICPTNVGNNTYSTALLIGEKATTIIAEDLGVRLRTASL